MWSGLIQIGPDLFERQVNWIRSDPIGRVPFENPKKIASLLTGKKWSYPIKKFLDFQGFRARFISGKSLA